MGEPRAEGRTAYTLLYEGERSGANGTKQKRSVPEAFIFAPYFFFAIASINELL